MSESRTAPERTGDVMSAAQFQEELRRIGRFNQLAVENPLADAVRKVRDNPTFAQSRLLTRILTALTYDRGEFRRAEASALDSATLGLVIALMNAAGAGTTARAEWVNAVTACDSAAAA